MKNIEDAEIVSETNFGLKKIDEKTEIIERKQNKKRKLNENIKYFYGDELKAIFEYANDSERIIYRLLYETGSRINEVLELKFNNIYYERERRINIISVKNSKQSNRSARKEVIISDNLKNEIFEFQKAFGLKDDNFICQNYHFVKRTKEPKLTRMTARTLDRHLKALIEKINRSENGIKIATDKAHAHTFRHTRAIDCLNAGMDLTFVQRLLGHENIGNTAIYLKYANSEFFDKFSEINKKLGL